MKKILITGSTGFIGSNLLKNLIDSNIIYITLRSNNLKKINRGKNLRIVYFKNHSELNKKLKKLQLNTIIHCATHYVKDHKFEDIKKIIKSNIEFGNILLENLDVMNVKKFINFTTIWENYNGIKDNSFNLYSVSKKAFGTFINFYNQKYKKIKFYNIFVSDTYGNGDRRTKLINLLQKNYQQKKNIKIVSKNLFLNLINIKDVILAINFLLQKKIKPGNYNLLNNVNFRICNIIKKLMNKKKSKLKFQWLSSVTIKEKTYGYRKLPFWNPRFSGANDLINFILKVD